MVNVMKALRVLTIVIGMIVLFYVYASLPERVGISADELGNPQSFIPKSTFFYISLVLMVLSTVIYLLIREFLLSREDMDYTLKGGLTIWSNGLSAILNLFLSSVFVFLYAFNSIKVNTLDTFGNVVLATLILLILWLFSLLYFMNRKGEEAI